MKPISFLNYLIAAVLAMSLFILVYTFSEFFLTEVWLVTPKISPLITSAALIVLVFLFSLVDWRKILKENKALIFLLACIILLSGFVYREYRHLKLEREYLPKIYSVDPPFWGIQANIITIKGKNFFPAYKKGKVFLGEEELLIESWSEECVEAKQQVPRKFGIFNLRLVRSDGLVSNAITFEVRDPNELMGYY